MRPGPETGWREIRTLRAGVGPPVPQQKAGKVFGPGRRHSELVEKLKIAGDP